MISSLKLIKKITIFNLCFLIIITSCTDQKKTKDHYEDEILQNEAETFEPLIVPLNSNPLVKLPLIEAEICAELESIPVDLGRVVFIL